MREMSLFGVTCPNERTGTPTFPALWRLERAKRWLVKIVFGVTCPNERAGTPTFPALWRLERAKRWLVKIDYGRWPQRYTHNTSKTKWLTSVILRDADPTTSHSRHGAVGQDHPRSAGRINCPVCNLVAFSAISTWNLAHFNKSWSP